MKLPLSLEDEFGDIQDADGKVVCTTDGSDFDPDMDDQHVLEIVAACNSHGILVSALEQVAGKLCFCAELDHQSRPCDRCEAKAALAAIPK